MIRSKTVEIRETDLETANDLLKDPHWTFVTAFVCASADNNAQKVKYVLKKRDTYDDINMENSKELTEALETIDDMVDRIGKLVISIAHSNDDFICTECLYTAKMLYQIMWKYAREDDTARIYEEFQEITGRNIDD